MPRDVVFHEFVRLLEKYQGDYLRQLSDAVAGIVHSIFSGPLPPSKTFTIEVVEQAQILEQPKGSSQLLRLIDPTLVPSSSDAG